MGFGVPGGTRVRMDMGLWVCGLVGEVRALRVGIYRWVSFGEMYDKARRDLLGGCC